MRFSATIVGLVVILLGLACGGSGDDGGDESIALPGTKERVLEQYAELLDESGVPPRVARCYTRELRDRPDSFFEQFGRQAKMTPKLLRLNRRLHEECVPSGAPSIDPNASSEEVDEALDLLEPSLRDVLEQQGASSVQIDCVIQGLRESPDEELIMLINASSPADARSVFDRVAEQCGAVR